MRSSRSMNRLADHLRRQGFAVLNLDYPSTSRSLEALASLVHPQVAAFCGDCLEVHFVGFSMGGLLVRAYLGKHRPGNLGRIVMIGTPNNGSEVADILKTSRLFRAICGPAGQQLVTDQSAFADVFGEPRCDVGIIAGNARGNPLARYLFDAPNDGKVSVASTLLPGCRDHVVVRRNHTLLVLADATLRETAAFLRDGKFSDEAERMISLSSSE
ncbi:lipase [Agrobacterium rubi]|nr:lipase [Agrobacterium rubi]NTF24034.1 lipase [Agrobacterium rubi]